ncbi:GDSL esterase/lipase At1g33811-like [Triticum dicoccoides]|uniref:GDSL esterase/lipase At1g33811-like n=1 Tax=Triticum dicoccoides TaxID=85692 RepID=UPI000E7CD85B|nr:GDSL esterase/lipase At1g33811-like [Triticum dicoccoides]
MMGNYHLLLLVMVVAVVLHAPAAVQAAAQKQLVPCMYIFGDSLVDNGNNNNILSLARANYRPYGVDFPDGAAPPGRFTNGRTMVDLLAGLLGFQPPFIPAYAMAQPSDYARGLNFASGAAGVRPETGNNLGGHYPLTEQVSHFRSVVGQIAPAGRDKRLGRCIYYVGMGSNDYLNNYFMPDYYNTAQTYDPAAYAAALLQEYERQLTALYALGARKFVVAGVGQIGCIPYELARIDDDGDDQGRGRPPPTSGIGLAIPGITVSIGGSGGNRSTANGGAKKSGCNDKINSAIAIYNKGLLAMVKRLNRGQQTPGANLVFLNAVNSGKDLAANAAAYGFTVLDRGCCGVGRNNGQITCLPMQRPCDDRTKYIFWDAFHPTEAANRIIANKVFSSSSTSDAYPINVSRLAAI